MTIRPRLECIRHVIQVEVLGDEVIDCRIGHGVHGVGKLVDSPGVDLDTQLDLRFGLVTFGDSDVAHVVAKAGEFHVLRSPAAKRGAGPHLNAIAGGLVTHVAHNGGARDAHPGLDVGVLAVTVSCLVEVHEVKVDTAPRQFHVGLGVEVEQWLRDHVEACDPHLGGAEGVHPGDNAEHLVVSVCLKEEAPDRVGTRQDGLPHDLDRDVARGVEDVDNALRLRRHLGESLGAVELLAAGGEPHLEGVEVREHAA